MCMFCTAVPMTVALCARAHVKHLERGKAAEARSQPPPKIVSIRAIQTATAIAALGLVVGAVVYHTSLST